MSYQQGMHQQKVLYRADESSIQKLRSMREHFHHICRHYTNQFVRIETMDGHVITGRIVNCDRGLLHLAVPNQGTPRAFFNPYNQDELILTLVLYELLVITLLYT
ncbi:MULTISPECIES: hypothetical protein [Paenibacillus]|uniref:Uncharacterized protein n=1 Tax=Paenibacillus apis TaxID=1792174 RepID=A0A919XY34_9BACL|nr:MULTISPECIES: hypothetical protein [Paenibacillus]GIO41104.1 hypothetical protein J41TS4_08620 [Paenibacillus apis]